MIIPGIIMFIGACFIVFPLTWLLFTLARRPSGHIIMGEFIRFAMLAAIGLVLITGSGLVWFILMLAGVR